MYNCEMLATPVPKAIARVVVTGETTNAHPFAAPPITPPPPPTPPATPPSPTIRLYTYGGNALVFDNDTMRELTVEHGVCGQLSGTLPLAPQQNTLLGYPLRITFFETVWLVRRRIARLVDGTAAGNVIANNWCNNEQEQERLIRMHESAVDAWREEKRRDALRAGARWRGVSKPSSLSTAAVTSSGTSPTASAPDLGALARAETEKEMEREKEQRRLTRIVFMETPTGDAVQGEELMDVRGAIVGTGRSLSQLRREYSMYAYLKGLGLGVLPGMRFGGVFVVYPGDPLRYHAHQIVNTRAYATEDVDLFTLCNRARLATGVRKVWVVGGDPREEEGEGEDDDDVDVDADADADADCANTVLNEDDICSEEWREGEMVCFSVEWAGF